MGRPSTGELRRLVDGFEARITIKGRDRAGFRLPTCKTESEARERCAAMAEIAMRVRRAGFVDHLEKLLEQAALARAGRSWEAVAAAVNTLCAGNAEDAAHAKVPTFEDFAKEWTSGKLHKDYPDHVPDKDSEQDARRLTKYVNPVIGGLLITEVTLDDADRVMAELPDELKATGRPMASATRRHVAQIIRRLLGFAVYPARHLKENPVPRGWLPKVKMTKAFTYLYPDEDALLLACAGDDDAPGVPLHRRLFFGVLAREGLRRGELAALRWRDLDLTRGIISLDKNKTDDPRAWALDAAVARALAAWHVLQGEPEAGELVFPDGGGAYHLAGQLRDDAHTAKLTRPQLFERSATRLPIRVHDLRATFVTVSLATGKTEAWVSDRTGHKSSVMINRYRRAARQWGEIGLGPLLPLDVAIPELRTPPADQAVEAPEPLAESALAAVPSEAFTPGIAPEFVPRDGIEPPTRGFSIPCSTN